MDKKQVENILLTFYEFGVYSEGWLNENTVEVSIPKGTTDTRPGVDALGAKKLSEKILTTFEIEKIPVNIEFNVRNIIWTTADAVFAEKELVRSI